MVELYEVEMEPEVRSWLTSLTDVQHARVEYAVDMLTEKPLTLGEPFGRHLGGKTRELRFKMSRLDQRISYWVAPRKRIILLTQFHKTKLNEKAEVARAIAAQEECEARHAGEATHEYSRTTKKGE